MLEYTHGIISKEHAEMLYEELDHVHGMIWCNKFDTLLKRYEK